MGPIIGTALWVLLGVAVGYIGHPVIKALLDRLLGRF